MIKFGIIGAGAIARRFANDIRLANNAELVAVASRSLPKAQTFADEFGAEFAFGSYDEIVKSNKVDAIYVATPHSHHYEHTMLALDNGLHVLCEKPIAINKNQLTRMINKAKEEKLVLMEALWSRFLPGTKKVKEIIESKIYGEIKQMDFAFGFELAEDYPADGRLLNPDLAGGSLLDLGIYPISIMQYFHPKKIIELEVNAVCDPNGIDLDTSIVARFEGKSCADLRSSIQQNLSDTGHIKFEKAEMHLPRFYHCQEIIINGEKEVIPCIGEGFVDEIEAFSKTVLDGDLENDIMTHQAMLDEITLLDKIRRISEENNME